MKSLCKQRWHRMTGITLRNIKEIWRIYPLRYIYQKYNPEDVEMVYGTDVIWFVPAQKLLRVKKEYSYLDADIIIANINGDSVFMKGPIVYTCPRGTGRLKIEKGADSFEAFIEAISLSE